MINWQKLLLICILSVFSLAYLPDDATVRKEFLAKNPNVEIVSSELIFEQDGVVTYSVKFKENSSDEIKMTDFALRQDDWKWLACDDRTEVRCEKNR